MDQEQLHKSHRSHKTGASAKKNNKKGNSEEDGKKKNPKVHGTTNAKPTPFLFFWGFFFSVTIKTILFFCLPVGICF